MVWKRLNLCNAHLYVTKKVTHSNLCPVSFPSRPLISKCTNLNKNHFSVYIKSNNFIYFVHIEYFISSSRFLSSCIVVQTPIFMFRNGDSKDSNRSLHDRCSLHPSQKINSDRRLRRASSWRLETKCRRSKAIVTGCRSPTNTSSSISSSHLNPPLRSQVYEVCQPAIAVTTADCRISLWHHSVSRPLSPIH